MIKVIYILTILLGGPHSNFTLISVAMNNLPINISLNHEIFLPASIIEDRSLKNKKNRVTVILFRQPYLIELNLYLH